MKKKIKVMRIAEKAKNKFKIGLNDSKVVTKPKKYANSHKSSTYFCQIGHVECPDVVEHATNWHFFQWSTNAAYEQTFRLWRTILCWRHHSI